MTAPPPTEIERELHAGRPPLEVWTARLGYKGPLRWLDVSLQGNLRRAEAGTKGGQDGIGLTFAPSPALLYPYLSKRKFGRLTAEDWPRYAEGYRREMRGRYGDKVWRTAFDLLLQREHVVLLCFCTNAEQCQGAACSAPGCEHCHRRLLADILVRLGAVYRGEIAVPSGAKPAVAPGEVVIGPSGGRCAPFVIGAEAGEEPVRGIICRGRSRSRCKACGSGTVERACDYPLSGAKEGKTCDMPLCARCATRIAPEMDYCPAHVRAAQEE